MAASAVGPPSGVAAILSASLGNPHYKPTYSAKVANIRASNIAPRPVGGRPSRGTRTEPPTDERSQTRLFNADEAYTERDASCLATKTAFADYLEDPAPVMQGDLIPYHMPDTVVSGVDDNAAIAVDLISRAGGYRPPCSERAKRSERSGTGGRLSGKRARIIEVVYSGCKTILLMTKGTAS